MTRTPTGRGTLLVLAAATWAGCSTNPPPTADPGAAATDVAEVVVVEPSAVAEPFPEWTASPLWETEPRAADGLAGLAVWPGVGQRPWLVVAARESHRLVLFDAASGELLREFGALGERPGSFRGPVDVAVAGDLAFVVERDNARLQVLRLPGLSTVGFLGEGRLERPVAVAVEPVEEGWAVWVAEESVVVAEPGEGDPALEGAPADEPQGTAAAVGTVHRFTVTTAGSSLADRRWSVELGSAGRFVALGLAPQGAAALAVVSSPDGPLASGRSRSLLDERPVDVVAGPVVGVAPFPCRAGHGWLVARPDGLLALSPEGPAAAVGLAGVDTAAVALALFPRAERSTASTLFAVTVDSRVVAFDGGDLALGLDPIACR